jgi:hypothetical protein
MVCQEDGRPRWVVLEIKSENMYLKVRQEKDGNRRRLREERR